MHRKLFLNAQRGFTLIELSVVLVIIGLITAGILVGQDLIKSSEVRSQITQITQYNAAVGTFQNKYGGLPGDLLNPSQYGLTGSGNGDGILMGQIISGSHLICRVGFLGGEEAYFWPQLSQAGYIDAGITAQTTLPYQASSAFPAAKIGRGNYVYVFNGGIISGACTISNTGDGYNYFGIIAITKIQSNGAVSVSTSIPVIAAYNIDNKMDDGSPQSGNVMAQMGTGTVMVWAAGGGNWGDSDPNTGLAVVSGDGVATTPSATTCYDNAGVAGNTEKYSIGYMNGTNPNCALVFKFQQ